MGDVPAGDLLNRWMSIRTGGDLLRGELAFALAKAVKIVRGLRQALTRDEHEAVADHVVRQIAAKPNDPWKLNEELPPPPASR